jgi:ADP-ribose pyrophosphatase YjhB (NUDIX family)
MVWKPHVTVAAIIEKDQQFLMVEESINGTSWFNQPAGHLEANESLIDAVRREVFEETAWSFEPTALIGTQLWQKSPEHPTFLRFCFTGKLLHFNQDSPLDPDIIRTHWLTRSELIEQSKRLRSPLVLKSIDQYLQGDRHPLSLLHTYLNPL